MTQNEIIQFLKSNDKAYISVHTLNRGYLCYLNCMSDDAKRLVAQRKIQFRQVWILTSKGVIHPDYESKPTKGTTLYYYNKGE